MSGISHMMLTDFSLGPTYEWTAYRSSATEDAQPNVNSTINVDIRTTGVLNGTVLYWTVQHITTSAADFSATSGSFTVTEGVGSLQFYVTADSLTEGTETFNTQIRTGSTAGPVVLTVGPTSISDTSTGPVTPTYSVPSTFSINEGVTGSVTVTTTNVANGTTLYWTISHTSTSAADFSAVSGSFTISAGSGTVSITTVADSLTEGSETFTLQIRTVSTSGTIVATSTGTISDTSTTALDTISTNLTTANRIVYAQAAQNDLIPISASEYASYANGVTGIQAQTGMKDGGYASVNTISSIVTPGPQRQTAFSTTYWVGVQAGYVFAVKVKTAEGPGVTIGTGFQIGYGTTTNGAGVAISNKLTRTTVTDANGFVYFVVKQPSVNVTAGVYMTILVNGFTVSFVGQSSAPANNAGTTWVYAGASSSTPITQTLNNSGQYCALAVSWLSTTTRPW